LRLNLANKGDGITLRIAVFDSGIGSLSIIKAIQKKIKSEIIYFADKKNFPYGIKTKTQLKEIINKTIQLLKMSFKPTLIVMGSNTPTLLLNGVKSSRKFIGVLPPIKKAAKISKTNRIAILATKSAVKSKELTHYIKKCSLPKTTKIFKIDVSPLISLVEDGRFISNKQFCQKKITNVLAKKFEKNKIDVATLSSTHLPFLRPLLEKQFPSISFLDPSETVAKKVAKMISKAKQKKASLKIYTSGNPKKFQKQLKKLGIKNKVSFLAGP
jgi:glutamate racemase